MRRFLVAELGLAGLEVATPDGHGPLVVARSHGLVPGRRIAGAVIDHVQLGVVGVPAPVGAAADLPGIALPGLQAQAKLAIVRVVAVECLVQQQILVGTGGIGAPGLPAVLDVVGGDVTAHAQFGAGRTDQHLVASDEGRAGEGRAHGDIGVLHLPDFLAAVGIQRNNVAIQLVEEDFRRAVIACRDIGQTTVDHVATGDRTRGGVLLGLVLPLDAPRIIEVDGEDIVREGRVDIHDAVGHQGTALMAMQGPGGEGPRHLQVLHVAGVDVVQLAEMAGAVVLRLHDPVAVILRHEIQVLVSDRGCRHGRQGHRDQRAIDGCCQASHLHVQLLLEI